MSKYELWALYVKRNRSFEEGPTIIFRPQTLRRFFDQVWDQAFSEGRKQGPTTEEMGKAAQAIQEIFGNVL